MTAEVREALERDRGLAEQLNGAQHRRLVSLHAGLLTALDIGGYLFTGGSAGSSPVITAGPSLIGRSMIAGISRAAAWVAITSTCKAAGAASTP